MNQLPPELYTIAWLAPLEIEARAALCMLDNHHQGRFPMTRGDDYVFLAGDLCGHNVIIATLPAGQEGGAGSAAALASQVKKFFPNLWFGLLVGVAAGLPNLSRQPPLDIRLGDVLIGLPDGENAGLIAYDLGKETGQNGLQLLHGGRVLASTETVVRSAMGNIRLIDMDRADSFLPYYHQIKDKRHSCGTFIDPGQENDSLYETVDETERLVERKRRPSSDRTRVWYGCIGTGEKLIKSAKIRDELRDRYDIIGLEMEAAGVMNRLPLGVIRGVCDYGDKHHNEEWKPYASAMAAAYAKAILIEIKPKEKQQHMPVSQNVALEVNSRNKRPLGDKSFTIADGRPKYRHPEATSSDDEVTQAVKASRRKKQIQALLESLQFERIDSRFDSIEKAYGTTCQWLLTTSEYLNWLSPNMMVSHHGFLWIKGKPGAGKSTLMKFAVRNAEEELRGTITSFFFNARGVDLEKSTKGMYRSLLLQLLKKIPSTQKAVEPPRWLLQGRETRDWSIPPLKDLFEQALLGLGQSPLFCFIDALDECDEAEIRDMVSFFEDICKLTTSKGILFHVCVSSRHYPHVTISKGINLDLQAQEGHDQDIVRYLENLKIKPEKAAERIRAKLTSKAAGVFIWVVLVVGILQREYDHGATPCELEERLRDIPADLNKLFYNILTRDTLRKDRLLLCIRWVLFARQPLRPEQLYLALLSAEKAKVDCYWKIDEIEKASIERFILSASKGLVEITQSTRCPTVQFIHESVRDFLLKENRLRSIWPGLGGIFEGESHDKLKQCCLNYMSVGIMNMDTIVSLPCSTTRDVAMKLFPFLEYAVRNIFYHADKAQAGGVSQNGFMQSFQNSEKENWIKLDNILETHTLLRHNPTVSLLYLLAQYNASNLISCHPNRLSYFEVESEYYGIPVLAAMATGSHDAVSAFMRALANTKPATSPFHRICEDFNRERNVGCRTRSEFRFSQKRSLLSNLMASGNTMMLALALYSIQCSDIITSRDGSGRTVLHYAAAGGFDDALQSQLDAGADAQLADMNGLTPVSIAAEQGHEAIVRMLLSKSTFIQTPRGYRPIYYAIKGGNKAIVQLFLDYDANIQAIAGSGQTPLLLATRKGCEDIVALLLDMGANVNVTDNDGRTPLSLAAAAGYEAIVEMLLSRNANLETTTGRSPLYYAIKAGYDTVVQLLCNYNEKQNIELPDIDGYPPLVWAAREGFESLVRVLLRGNANIEATTGLSPLYHAARKGHTEIVRLLLNRGAFTEVSDDGGRTPLFRAISQGNTMTAQLLLEYGANMETADNSALNALLVAVLNALDPRFIALLLDKGAHIEATNKRGRTSLSLAVTQSSGFDTVLQLVLFGANINTADENGRTPLSWAATVVGGDIMVSLLLSHGADIEATDTAGRTALSWAVAPGHIEGRTPFGALSSGTNDLERKEVALLLLNHGANTNARDRQGRPPLWWASNYTGNASITTLLITKGADLL